MSLDAPWLEFYGAAGRVTGSCHILHLNGRTVLLDCGFIQGSETDEAGNAGAFPFDPAAIDAVVLSHAHLDHAGRLPLLVKRGFNGTIHAHRATRALLRILLNDAANLELNRVRRRNRRREEAGEPLLEPLYGTGDVERTVDLVQGHKYEAPFDVVPGLRVRLHDAGHILGAAVVEAAIGTSSGQRTLIFSGDIGQYDSPILRDPQSPERADLLIMETTYGDRLHRDRQASLEEFADVLEQAHRDGGNVLIPAFAVGRSQEILYHLGKHYDEWQIGRWQVFLDSPLAIEASEIYWDFPHLFDDEASELFRERDFMPKLPNLHFTRTANESKVISRLKRGAIIIAGSGMCNGGRILHHLKRDLGRPAAKVVFTGFQPPGTLGRRIIDGADTVRIHGESVSVRASVHTIGGFSAHADQRDLLRWYDAIDTGHSDSGALRAPVWLVHGDPEAAGGFQQALREHAGVDARIAAPGDRADLV